jgi:hypothetical protein
MSYLPTCLDMLIYDSGYSRIGIRKNIYSYMHSENLILMILNSISNDDIIYIKYLYKYCDVDLFFKQEILNELFVNQKMNIIILLYNSKQIHYPPELINNLIEYNSINSIKFLYKHGTKFITTNVNMAANIGSLHILMYFYSINKYINNDICVSTLITKKYYHILKFLYKYNHIQFTQDNIDEGINSCNINIIKFYTSLNLYGSTNCINNLFTNGLHILKYYIDINQFPWNNEECSEVFITWKCSNKNIILKFLYNNNKLIPNIISRYINLYSNTNIDYIINKLYKYKYKLYIEDFYDGIRNNNISLEMFVSYMTIKQYFKKYDTTNERLNSIFKTKCIIKRVYNLNINVDKPITNIKDINIRKCILYAHKVYNSIHDTPLSAQAINNADINANNAYNLIKSRIFINYMDVYNAINIEICKAIYGDHEYQMHLADYTIYTFNKRVQHIIIFTKKLLLRGYRPSYESLYTSINNKYICKDIYLAIMTDNISNF